VTRESDRPKEALGWLLGLGAYAQGALTLPMLAAPSVAATFSLGDRDLALLIGTLSLGSFGALLLARLADRRGRRGALRISFAGLGPALLVTALAPNLWVYGVAQLCARGLDGALRAVSTVAITEVAAEQARARAHAWLGLLSALSNTVPLGLIALVGDRPGGWRLAFAALSLPVLALPWVWRRIPETRRFQVADQTGRIERARMRDLLRPRYRRRAVGLGLVGLLRGAALSALGFYLFHHAVTNVGLETWRVAALFAGGGSLGIVGNPLGAFCSERWGRRPTQVVFASLTVLFGVGYYQIPAGLGIATGLGLGLAFGLYVLCVQAFAAADRLVDTELFPTALRSSYAGLRIIVEAFAAVLGNFGLAACLTWLGQLELAIAVWVPSLLVPALGIFWWATTETRGMLLDEAALEDPPDLPERSPR
jgi:predicted MFS family arabinose efflux permease